MRAYVPELTEEDKRRYLEALLGLQQSEVLTLGRISEFLQVLPSSAARILRALQKENWLQVDKYHGTIALSGPMD